LFKALNMKRFNKNIITIAASFLFVAAISSDPLIHDHFEDIHSSVECEFCENKTLDTAKTQLKVAKVLLSETKSDEIEKNFFSPYFYNFKSRAPPKT